MSHRSEYIILLGEIPETPYPFRIMGEEEHFLGKLRRARNSEYALAVGPIERGRTIQQNRAGWGLGVKEIAARTGYTWREVYDITEAAYYESQGGWRNPEAKRYLKDLTQLEWMVFWPWFQQLGAEWCGADIKDPDPQMRKTPIGAHDSR